MWTDARPSPHSGPNALETRMNPGDPSIDARAMPAVLPLGELVRRIALALERGFGLQWVAGEVSNVTRAGSGHWYFSLKDRDAQARCVMFRNRNQYVEWTPRDGDRVEARVVPGLYTPRGEFQLQVEQLRRAGAGVLFEAFLRIKAALEAAGLFDAARKRPLPPHPRTIGVVTSLQAAALRDVLTTLARRAPHVRVIVYPTPVQGQDAPQRLVEAIAAAAHARAPHPIDVLLVVRGGGSIEDLWAFNDERVAHAIAAARVPVVSGVGHETDFTIADFVADVRAPTPTAAAELASPDAFALTATVARHAAALRRALQRSLDQRAQRVDDAAGRLRSPEQRLLAARARLDDAIRRLARAGAATIDRGANAVVVASGRLRRAGPNVELLALRIATTRDRLARTGARRLSVATQAVDGVAGRLALLDPRGILSRGYAIATTADGTIVRDAAQVRAGDALVVEVARGRVSTRVVASDGTDATDAGPSSAPV